MHLLIQDLRFALKTWRKSLAFTAVAILTVALGVGGTTAIYSIVRGVLWRPLPYDNYERLVHLFEARPGQGPNMGLLASVPTFEDWKRESRLLEDFARISTSPIVDFILASEGGPQELMVFRISSDAMRLLGTQPLLGRRFEPCDEAPGQDRVFLLSYSTWQRRFGGAEDIVGRQLRFTRGTYTIVGVMPKAFEYPPAVGAFVPSNVDGWVPAPTDSAFVTDRMKQSQHVLALMKPGVSEKEALEEMAAITQRLSERHPEKEGWGVRLIGIHSRFHKYSRNKTMLLTLLAAVGFVLLIGCTNIAGLLLTRATSRHREIAVRAALGAGPWRIASQLLVESVLLALVGGVLGVLVAFATLESLKARLPGGLPRLDLIEIDSGVLLFSLAVTLAAGLAFGVFPALFASRPNLAHAVKVGSSQSGGRRWAGNGLVVFEVAISTVLLVGSGLMVKSFVSTLNAETGFALEESLIARPRLPHDQYADEHQAKRFHNDVAERVRALPGVEAAGWVHLPPLQFREVEGDYPISIEGRAGNGKGENPQVSRRLVSEDYLEAAGFTLMQGRTFEHTDTPGSSSVAIINAAAARTFWPGDTALGKRIKPGGSESSLDWHEVVGIVSDAKVTVDRDPIPMLYLPLRQVTQMEGDPMPRYFGRARAASLLIRTSGSPDGLADAVRNAVWQVDADQPVEVQTMVQLVQRSLEPQEFSAFTVSAFAGVALILALIGIHGTLAHAVTSRTREIGVRLAIGAQREDIFRSIVGRAAVLAIVGVAMGQLSSWWLTRWLEGNIYGVEQLDPAVLLGVAVAVALASLFAAYLPARRAMAVDPNIALRQE